MERYTKILGAIALCAMACSSRGNTNVITPDPDASMTTDTGSMPVDTGSMPTDTGSMPTDTGSMPTDRPMTTDRGMATVDTGPAMNFGTCGETTVDCLCAAGADGAAQNRCIGTNMDCAACINDAAGTCCPTQAQALQDCVNTNMCADQACVTANCTMQVNALNTCFMAAQMSNMACQTTLGGCFGSFPIMCGG